MTEGKMADRASKSRPGQCFSPIGVQQAGKTLLFEFNVSEQENHRR